MLLDQENIHSVCATLLFTYKYLSCLAIQKSIKFSSLEEDIFCHIGGIDIKVNIQNQLGYLTTVETTELDFSEKCSKSCMNKQATDAGWIQDFP